jgi:hypothetical protein
MDASRGFLSGTVDKFKMVKILTSAHGLCFPMVILSKSLLGRSSRRNRVAGWLPWWHPSLLSSCSYTTSPSSSTASVASSALQQLCVGA